ncbi:glutamyl-tRNA synthetase [Candidatus Tremblaya phenacola PAVE]|nr:glutamyl-tRNA synthetase [Candidatus Tremblaya phenacola PAVE]
MIKHPSPPFKTRFAPSPSGGIHLGNVRAALLSWLFIRKEGGSFVLRFENTDFKRTSKTAVRSIIKALRWLNIRFDQLTFQQARLEVYFGTLKQLLFQKKVNPNYHAEVLELEKHLGLELNSRSPTIRPNFQPTIQFHFCSKILVWKDHIKGTIEWGHNSGPITIIRSDGTPTFNFCSVVDDVEMKTTHIIRGDDHIPNTKRQVHMFEAVGSCPPKYSHFPMILDAKKRKLSKRHHYNSVSYLNEMGFLPSALTNFLVASGRVVHSELSCLAKTLDLRTIGSSPISFDLRRLEQFNYLKLKGLNYSLTFETAQPSFFWGGISLRMMVVGSDLLSFVRLVKDRSKTMRHLSSGFVLNHLKTVIGMLGSGPLLQSSCLAVPLPLGFGVIDWNKPSILKAMKVCSTGQAVTLPNLCYNIRNAFLVQEGVPLLELVLSFRRHLVVRHAVMSSSSNGRTSPLQGGSGGSSPPEDIVLDLTT